MAFLTEADQAWFDDWANHIKKQLGGEIRRELKFRAEASKHGLISSNINYGGMEESEAKELFWRTEDAVHLKEWTARCSEVISGKPKEESSNMTIYLRISLEPTCSTLQSGITSDFKRLDYLS
jgi:hypothetical protein